jgi:glycosyltransferase involved in cell wall biosynthesis
MEFAVLNSSNLIERRSGLPYPLPSLRSLARLVGLIRNSDAVLVHDGMYATSVATIVAARLLGRPSVLVQHIGHVPSSSLSQRTLFAIADRFLTRPMLRIASQVVFISATSARHFERVTTRSEPMLIFNGVDSAAFRPSVSLQERRHEREQIGWPTERPVILFVGRFLEKKGLLRLRRMSSMRPDLHWAYAGWGPCDPAAWNLPNVTVHRDRSGPELAPLYRAADLLVLPSKSEGFPLVVQEALACGLRPICCDDAAKADSAAGPHLISIGNEGSETEIVSRYLDAVDALAIRPDSLDERERRSGFARHRYSWNAAASRYSEIVAELCCKADAQPQPGRASA